MTVSDLRALLDDALGNSDPDAVEVRLAMQPTWPMEYSIDEGPDPTIVTLGDGKEVIYLPEGFQVGYLPSEASVALGWRNV